MAMLLRMLGIAVAAGLLVAAVPACGAAGGGRQPDVTSTQELAGLRCRVTLTPATPRAMAPFTLRVVLSGAAAGSPMAAGGAGGSPGAAPAVGSPGAGPAAGSVAASFTMPAMSMTPVRPELERSGPGVFTGRAILPMSGDWKLEVVAGAGPHPTRFAFPITCE